MNIFDPRLTDLYNRTIAIVQRAKPEQAMIAVCHAAGGGVLDFVIEHVGDLTHRMTETATASSAGYEYVANKVEKSLRTLDQKYGFRREFKENVQNNAKCDKVPFEQLMERVTALLRVYAEEHRKLPAYTKGQQVARDAAVALGEMRFEDASELLHQLKDVLDKGEEEWVKYARTPIIDIPGMNESAQSIPPTVQMAYFAAIKAFEGKLDGLCIEVVAWMVEWLRKKGVRAFPNRYETPYGGHWTLTTEGIEVDPTIGWWARNERPKDAKKNQLYLVSELSPHRNDSDWSLDREATFTGISIGVETPPLTEKINSEGLTKDQIHRLIINADFDEECNWSEGDCVPFGFALWKFLKDRGMNPVLGLVVAPTTESGEEGLDLGHVVVGVGEPKNEMWFDHTGFIGDRTRVVCHWAGCYPGNPMQVDLWAYDSPESACKESRKYNVAFPESHTVESDLEKEVLQRLGSVAVKESADQFIVEVKSLALHVINAATNIVIRTLPNVVFAIPVGADVQVVRTDGRTELYGINPFVLKRSY